MQVYEWRNDAWIQLGSGIDGEAADNRSGASVSLSADGYRVAIGAYYNDGNGHNAGHVRVYEWVNGTWQQIGEDIDGETESELSGYSVSLSADGNRVAIGAPYNNGNGHNAGLVRVYEYVNGTPGSWGQIGWDIEGEAENDSSGRSLALSGDGNRVAVGAPGNSDNGNSSGQVRIYDLSLISDTHSAYNTTLEIYPNPTDGTVYFTSQVPEGIIVRDALGKVILQQEGPIREVDLSSFPNGMYVLHTILNNHPASSIIVKQ